MHHEQHAPVADSSTGQAERKTTMTNQGYAVSLHSRRLPMRALREAAGAPSGKPEHLILPERATRLNARPRELILHTVRVLLNE